MKIAINTSVLVLNIKNKYSINGQNKQLNLSMIQETPRVLDIVINNLKGTFEWNWNGYLHRQCFRTNPRNKLIIKFMGNWQIKLESYTFQALNTNINYNSTNYLGGYGILNFFKIKIRFLAAMAISILGLIIFKYCH